MLCQYCGEEMDKGLVQSARPIFWSQKMKKVFFIPTSEEDIPIVGVVVLKNHTFAENAKKMLLT